MAFPKYPSSLTYAEWNNKKAKLTPTTGLGTELKKLEAWFKNVPQREFTELEAVKSPQEIQDAAAKAKAAFPKIEAYRKSLFAFARTADAAAKTAKKSKTFPSKSRSMIEAMAKDASDFATTIRDYPDGLYKQKMKEAEDYDKRLDKKIKDTKETHAKLKAHRASAMKQKDLILDAVKKAEQMMKGAKAEDGKKLLAKAANAIKKIEDLAKACQKDSAEWRTAKSNLSGTDMKDLIPLSNEIMQCNKAVLGAQQECEEAIKKAMSAHGARR